MSSVRIDRLLTIGIVQPVLGALRHVGARRGDTSRDRPLPILMYHSISDDSEIGVTPYYRTATSARRFAEQMHFLDANGWRAVNLCDGLGALAKDSGNHAMEKLVVLTFDDGFRDFYTTAFPVLHQFGFSATMYLSTGFIGDGKNSLQFHGRDCLTWPQVRELHAAGIEFGSHTVNHPKLVDLSWPEVEFEIGNSKAEIERRLECAVHRFAYPFAFPRTDKDFVSRLRDGLLAAGYHDCVTTEIGCVDRGDDLFSLRRLPVNDADDPALFAAKLDGAYDWLAWPQRTVKSFKAALRRSVSS